jgi:hypothetical protein
MKNVLLEEQLGRIKRLLNEKKTENTQTILSEQPIVPTLLKRFLGSRVVSKMETSFGDDVIKNLESLFVKSSANIIKDATGEVFILSRAGTKIPMKTISTGLDNVASGKMTSDDLVKLLPSKLKDGTDFKVIIQNELKNAEPKTVKTGTSTSTTSKPKSKPGKTKAQITQDLLTKSIKDEESFKTYLVNELKEYSLPAMYKGKEQKFINEIWATIDKNSKGAITKFNKSVKDLEMTLERLSYQDRETVLKNAVEGIKKSNKSLWDKFSQNFQFWSDPQYKSLTIAEKYTQTLKMSGYINLGTIILDLTRLFLETENTEDLDWQGHFGFSAGTTITMKVGAAAVPRLNVFLSTVLFAESLLRNVYEYSGLRKKIEGSSVKRNALGGSPPSEDEVDFNDNK